MSSNQLRGKSRWALWVGLCHVWFHSFSPPIKQVSVQIPSEAGKQSHAFPKLQAFPCSVSLFHSLLGFYIFLPQSEVGKFVLVELLSFCALLLCVSSAGHGNLLKCLCSGEYRFPGGPTARCFRANIITTEGKLGQQIYTGVAISTPQLVFIIILLVKAKWIMLDLKINMPI